jgi:hypothetical protein
MSHPGLRPEFWFLLLGGLGAVLFFWLQKPKGKTLAASKDIA